MDQHHHSGDSGDLGDLLARVVPDPGDGHRLVAGAVSRGRVLRRRRQAGTAVAALAVFGVIGVTAAVVPPPGGEDRQDRAPVAADPPPTSSPSATASPTQDPTQDPLPPGPAPITVTADEVPGTVEALLGRQDAGPLRTTPQLAPSSSAHELHANFDWQGTLTSVVIEKEVKGSRGQCQNGGVTCTRTPAGDLQLTWGPDEGDGVTGQGVTTWRRGFEVTAISYNAADGKDVAPLMDAPPLSLADLALLASSDAWFER